MDSWQFMLLAERLIASSRDTRPHPSGSGGRAAEIRTAISRSYYAIFLTSRDLMNDLGYQVTEKGACHGVVHQALLESNERDLIRAAGRYATLGEYRRKADYDMNDREVEEIERAEDMLNLCKHSYSLIGQVRIKTQNDTEFVNRLASAIDRWLTRDAEKNIWK